MKHDNTKSSNEFPRFHSIKETSDFLGVSTYTLRYYEKQGMYELNRDEENNYRTFNREIIIYLDQIMRLKSLGVSLSDIKKIGRDYDVSQSMQILENLDLDIDTKIEELWREKKRIRDYQMTFRSILEDNGTFEIRQSPAFLCENIEDSLKTVSDDFEKLSPIYAPKFTFAIDPATVNEGLWKDPQENFGRSNKISLTVEIEHELVEKTNMIGGNFFIKQPTLCAHKIARIETGSDYSVFGDLAEFAASMGYQVTGTSMLRTLYINYYRYAYYELWAPLEKKSDSEGK